MLTPEDFKELKPLFEAIRKYLNVALVKSGADIPPEACAHFFEALLLMDILVDKAEQKMWQRYANSIPESSDLSILTEMIRVLGVGSASEMAEDFQEIKPDFEEIHWILSIAMLKCWGTDISEDSRVYFANALLLMKNLTHKVEYKVWDDIKASASRLIEENSDKSSLWESTLERARGFANRSAEKAGLLGMASGGTLAAIFTGGGGFGIAAGGTAVGVAGLAGAAALYLLYKGGEAALNTEQGRRIGGRLPLEKKTRR